MTKRKLEIGDLPPTKELKCEIDWSVCLGLDMMRRIISYIVFSVEKPIPRLDLVCRQFKKLFEEETEAYFSELFNTAPYVFSIFAGLELIKEDTKIHILTAPGEDQDYPDEEVLTFSLILAYPYTKWTCHNSHESFVSRSSRELIKYDPDAKTPYRDEAYADFVQVCDFLWYLDGIIQVQEFHLALQFGNKVGKPANTPKWDLIEHAVLKTLPTDVKLGEYATPYFDMKDVIGWCKLPSIWKGAKQAVWKWENKLKVNALIKATRSQESFRKKSMLPEARHRIKHGLAYSRSHVAKVSYLFWYWMEIVPKTESRTKEDLKTLRSEIMRTIIPSYYPGIKQPSKLYEEGLNIDFTKYFYDGEDYSFKEGEKESVLLVQEEIKRWWSSIFASFDSYLLHAD